VTTFDEFPFGFSWYPDEALTRTGQALDTGSGVWLIDPVDDPEAIARATALGPPAGVIQLLDRHNRDCAALAERFGVEHLKVPDAVPGTPLRTIPVVRFPGWKETALWWPERETLIVAEVVGSNEYYTGGRAPVGMHPMLRALPPKGLRSYSPRHLLMGHGAGVHGAAATPALRQAHQRARRDIPRVLAKLPTLGR